jgi:hypothetical protein
MQTAKGFGLVSGADLLSFLIIYLTMYCHCIAELQPGISFRPRKPSTRQSKFSAALPQARFVEN